MREQFILSIDQGTTSSRALAFDKSGAVRAVAQQEFGQIFPQDGWVEHDAMEIWQTTLACCQQVLDELGADNFAAIGITNQRETTVVWDRATGHPIGHAIVWQDRRTAAFCDALKQAGHEASITEKTGLLLDPYFSASKIAWLLDNVDGARARAEAGELAFGTIDSWLVWQLTGGAAHVTDASNAARTSLFNIHTQSWDDDLLALFNVPTTLMPEVKDNAADFGAASVLGGLPICGMAGDQQAATIGQACFTPGMIKSTYGTGCFVLANTGDKPAVSGNKLLTTIAYRLDGKASYALEGSIFMAGAIVQWLRDGLGLIAKASETQALAEAANPQSAVVLVPAFTGLGAPHWDAEARAAIFNMTRDSGKADIVRAALESVSLQTADLLRAISDDMASAGLDVPPRLRVDGGMVANDWLCQNLADLCACPIDRPEITETTALGAAMLAMLHIGWFESLEALAESWALQAQFSPAQDEAWRADKRAGWQAALQKVLTT
ncbi:MAG: glycerol kinase GlpK [Parvibaculales bacterium]